MKKFKTTDFQRNELLTLKAQRDSIDNEIQRTIKLIIDSRNEQLDPKGQIRLLPDGDIEADVIPYTQVVKDKLKAVK